MVYLNATIPSKKVTKKASILFCLLTPLLLLLLKLLTECSVSDLSFSPNRPRLVMSQSVMPGTIANSKGGEGQQDILEPGTVLKKGYHNLNLNKNHLPHWTTQDAFREFVQNWLAIFP